MKTMKQSACLEACKQLHQVGALTDDLVPDNLAQDQESECKPYVNEQAIYFPPELVSHDENDAVKKYYCYLIELDRDFQYWIPLQDTVVAVRTKLDLDNDSLVFDLDVDRGNLRVQLRYIGDIQLAFERVLLCQRFQVTLFRVLVDHRLNKVKEVLDAFCQKKKLRAFDYLLLPSTGSRDSRLTPSIDWKCVSSVLYPDNLLDNCTNCSHPNGYGCQVHSKNGLVCNCVLENSLVYTAHNGHLYCLTGTLEDCVASSLLELRDGKFITYKEYYEKRHGIELHYEKELFLKARRIISVQNYLQRCTRKKERGENNSSSVELPPELCQIIMSPISISTLYSFSFLPSIMHRIESLLIAVSLKKLFADHCTKKFVIPTIKVLEAITTKNCREKIHLESLETLGDSFLKYATSQQLFKTYQDFHEGLLTAKREKIISNVALSKLGCDRKLPGFIRNEPFDPQTWIVPGDYSENYELDEESLSATRSVFSRGKRELKYKSVADVVEALIGAFLSTGGEVAVLSFMEWLGVKVDFVNIKYEPCFPVQPQMLINVKDLESLLNYSFLDASLLVEALTHGSYMLPEIPRCYERLEFLGDSVLDYLITEFLYYKYPGLSPEQLTDLRSASVNNECYAYAAFKAGLHRHILHSSQELHRFIVKTMENSTQLLCVSTFGWESETTFPKALGDVIESLAGAIFVDSGYNKEVVFQSIRPLLEPLVTPKTLRIHPVKELTEFCQKEHYKLKKDVLSCENGVASIKIEVEANGAVHTESRTAENKKKAKMLACKAVLHSLKASVRNYEGADANHAENGNG